MSSPTGAKSPGPKQNVGSSRTDAAQPTSAAGFLVGSGAVGSTPKERTSTVTAGSSSSTSKTGPGSSSMSQVQSGSLSPTPSQQQQPPIVIRGAETHRTWTRDDGKKKVAQIQLEESDEDRLWGHHLVPPFPQERLIYALTADDLKKNLGLAQLTRLEKLFQVSRDSNESKALTCDEFVEAFGQTFFETGILTTIKCLKMIFMQIDADANGSVDWSELTGYMMMGDRNLSLEQTVQLRRNIAKTDVLGGDSEESRTAIRLSSKRFQPTSQSSGAALPPPPQTRNMLDTAKDMGLLKSRVRAKDRLTLGQSGAKVDTKGAGQKLVAPAGAPTTTSSASDGTQPAGAADLSASLDGSSALDPTSSATQSGPQQPTRSPTLLRLRQLRNRHARGDSRMNDGINPALLKHHHIIDCVLLIHPTSTSLPLPSNSATDNLSSTPDESILGASARFGAAGHTALPPPNHFFSNAMGHDVRLDGSSKPNNVQITQVTQKVPSTNSPRASFVRRYVTGGRDGTIRIWNADTGAHIFTVFVTYLAGTIRYATDAAAYVNGCTRRDLIRPDSARRRLQRQAAARAKLALANPLKKSARRGMKNTPTAPQGVSVAFGYGLPRERNRDIQQIGEDQEEEEEEEEAAALAVGVGDDGDDLAGTRVSSADANQSLSNSGPAPGLAPDLDGRFGPHYGGTGLVPGRAKDSGRNGTEGGGSTTGLIPEGSSLHRQGGLEYSTAVAVNSGLASSPQFRGMSASAITDFHRQRENPDVWVTALAYLPLSDKIVVCTSDRIITFVDGTTYAITSRIRDTGNCHPILHTPTAACAAVIGEEEHLVIGDEGGVLYVFKFAPNGRWAILDPVLAPDPGLFLDPITQAAATAAARNPFLTGRATDQRANNASGSTDVSGTLGDSLKDSKDGGRISSKPQGGSEHDGGSMLASWFGEENKEPPPIASLRWIGVKRYQQRIHFPRLFDLDENDRRQRIMANPIAAERAYRRQRLSMKNSSWRNGKQQVNEDDDDYVMAMDSEDELMRTPGGIDYGLDNSASEDEDNENDSYLYGINGFNSRRRLKGVSGRRLEDEDAYAGLSDDEDDTIEAERAALEKEAAKREILDALVAQKKIQNRNKYERLSKALTSGLVLTQAAKRELMQAMAEDAANAARNANRLNNSTTMSLPFLSGQRSKKQFRFWPFLSREEQEEFRTVKNQVSPAVRHLCFEPALDLLVSASMDGTVKQIDLSRIPEWKPSANNNPNFISLTSNAQVKGGRGDDPNSNALNGNYIPDLWIDPEVARRVLGVTHPELLRLILCNPLHDDGQDQSKPVFAEPAAVRRVFCGHSRGVLSVAYSSHFKLIASGGMDRQVQIWDPFNKFIVHTLSEHHAPVCHVAFDDYLRVLITVTTDKAIKVWDGSASFAPVHNLTIRTRFKPVDSVSASLYDHTTGQLIVTSSRLHTFTLTSLGDGAISSHSAPITCAVYNDQFGQVIAGDDQGVIVVWDVDTGRSVFRYRVPRPVTALALDSNKRRLLVGCDDGSIGMYNFSNGQKLSEFVMAETNSRSSMTALLDRSTYDLRNLLRSRRSKGRSEKITPVTTLIYCVSQKAQSKSKFVMAAGWDRLIKVWEERADTVVHIRPRTSSLALPSPQAADPSSANDAASSSLVERANQRMTELSYASACGDLSYTLGLASTSSQLLRHQDDILAMVMCEQRIATAGYDGVILVWGSDTLQPQVCLDPYLGHSHMLPETLRPVTCLQWIPSLGILASAGNDGFLRFWEIGVHQRPSSPNGIAIAPGLLLERHVNGMGESIDGSPGPDQGHDSGSDDDDDFDVDDDETTRDRGSPSPGPSSPGKALSSKRGSTVCTKDAQKRAAERKLAALFAARSFPISEAVTALRVIDSAGAPRFSDDIEHLYEDLQPLSTSHRSRHPGGSSTSPTTNPATQASAPADNTKFPHPMNRAQQLGFSDATATSHITASESLREGPAPLFAKQAPTLELTDVSSGLSAQPTSQANSVSPNPLNPSILHEIPMLAREPFPLPPTFPGVIKRDSAEKRLPLHPRDALVSLHETQVKLRNSGKLASTPTGAGKAANSPTSQSQSTRRPSQTTQTSSTPEVTPQITPGSPMSPFASAAAAIAALPDLRSYFFTCSPDSSLATWGSRLPRAETLEDPAIFDVTTRRYIVTGDSAGYIKVWDITDLDPYFCAKYRTWHTARYEDPQSLLPSALRYTHPQDRPFAKPKEFIESIANQRAILDTHLSDLAAIASASTSNDGASHAYVNDPSGSPSETQCPAFMLDGAVGRAALATALLTRAHHIRPSTSANSIGGSTSPAPAPSMTATTSQSTMSLPSSGPAQAGSFSGSTALSESQSRLYDSVACLARTAFPPHRQLCRQVTHWRAHKGRITSIDYVAAIPAILTTSADLNMKLWTLRGELIGTFNDGNASNNPTSSAAVAAASAQMNGNYDTHLGTTGFPVASPLSPGLRDASPLSARQVRSRDKDLRNWRIDLPQTWLEYRTSPDLLQRLASMNIQAQVEARRASLAEDKPKTFYPDLVIPDIEAIISGNVRTIQPVMGTGKPALQLSIVPPSPHLSEGTKAEGPEASTFGPPVLPPAATSVLPRRICPEATVPLRRDLERLQERAEALTQSYLVSTAHLFGAYIKRPSEDNPEDIGYMVINGIEVRPEVLPAQVKPKAPLSSLSDVAKAAISVNRLIQGRGSIALAMKQAQERSSQLTAATTTAPVTNTITSRLVTKPIPLPAFSDPTSETDSNKTGNSLVAAGSSVIGSHPRTNVLSMMTSHAKKEARPKPGSLRLFELEDVPVDPNSSLTMNRFELRR